MQELPNFFPHLNTVYHKELPKLKHKEYKTIFKHNEKKLLGNGANETIVYEGKFDLRNIAIKRVKKDHATKVAKETSIMQRISHINILKYFAKEEDYKYIYIGIELCECNLQTFINDTKWSNVMESKTIMRESAAGLSYLHQLNIRKY